MQKWLIATCLLCSLLMSVQPAHAQVRDNVWNGALIGGVVGAGAGIVFTHAVRDSDLTAGQYAYGAAVFGALGAGIGMGIDVMLFRHAPRPHPPKVVVAPAISRTTRAVAVRWRWK